MQSFMRSLSNLVLPVPGPDWLLFVNVIYFEQLVATSSNVARSRTSERVSSSSSKAFVSISPSSYNFDEEIYFG